MSVPDRTPWQIQMAVWSALSTREVKARFGAYRLGYLWALIEPLSHVLVLTFLFSFLGREGFQGIPFAVFFASGVLPFMLFSNMLNNGSRAVIANVGLFYYKQVKPMDTVVVRAIVELLTSLIAILFLSFVGIWFFNIELVLQEPLTTLILLSCLFFGGLGSALTAAVIATKSEDAGKFIPQIIRPFYFISGVMIPLQALPTQFHALLLWNPLLHGIEQLRRSLFPAYNAGETSILYFAGWAIMSLFFGVFIFRINQTRLLV